MKLLENGKYFIWGTGYQAEKLNELYGVLLEKIEVLGYIDNNTNRHGKTFFGKEILSPNILLSDKEANIIIANTYYNEILEQIKLDYPWYSDKIVESLFFEKLQLLSRYGNSTDPEIVEIVNYLKKHPLQVFNYDYLEKYEKDKYQIEYDLDKGLFYTFFQGKKMFFSRSFKNEEEVREYYYSVDIEQDVYSPHKYLTEIFDVKPDSVVIDAGVAEGNFALSIIDKVKKIYLFEPDTGWVEALKYTFANYMDKVVILNMCVSDYENEQTTTIDSVITDETIDFIKMDIEGEELYALNGAERIIESSDNLQCVICTYHQEFAYQSIKQYLYDKSFLIDTSKGYMWYPSDFNPMRPAVLRRGIIRAKKQK